MALREHVEIKMNATFKGQLARQIAAEADRRDLEPAELVADIIETVFTHQLVVAVLDD